MEHKGRNGEPESKTKNEHSPPATGLCCNSGCGKLPGSQMRSALSWKEREWGRNHLNTKRLKSRSDSGTGMC